MNAKLQAQTDEGRALIATAEELAENFATRAAAYDARAAFPTAHLDALRETRVLYAPVPADLGGLGVESVHDVFVASSRLAEGDASLVLGVNMHLLTLIQYTRQYRIACNREGGARVAAVAGVLRGFVEGGAAIAAAVSEPGQDLLRPATRATRTAGGWVLNGRKIFTSMAPAATHFTVALTYADEDDADRYAYAIVERGTPGVTVNDDWDAMGMRASGSVSVVFENTPLAGRGPGRGAPAGMLSAELLEDMLVSGAAHTSASLGIAEAAHAAAVAAVSARRAKSTAPVRGTMVQLAAENAVDLAGARAILDRALTSIDAYHAGHPVTRGTLDEARDVFAEVQIAKQFVNAAAVRIADRALTIAGGAGYANTNALSRIYRDARAGAFMHPLAANVAGEYIGAHALGLSPETF